MFETQKQSTIPRKMHPHHAVITMKIDIRKMYPDGTLDEQVLGNDILKKYNMSNKAQICFTAATENDCIKMVKERLERLNG